MLNKTDFVVFPQLNLCPMIIPVYPIRTKVIISKKNMPAKNRIILITVISYVEEISSKLFLMISSVSFE